MTNSAHEGVVVGHDPRLSKLVERLRKTCPENYDEIAVEYVTTEEIELVLSEVIS